MFNWVRRRFQQRNDAARINPERAEEEVPGFWTGPYGVLVPLHVKCIKSPDRLNMISRTVDASGTPQIIQTTLTPIHEPMSAVDYRATYCQKIEGVWYYIGGVV